MVSASAVPVSPLSNMLRYIYAISRFHRRILDCSYSSKKWLTFGAFRVNQKALRCSQAWLDDELPSRYNAMVMTVCMARDRLFAYPVPR